MDTSSIYLCIGFDEAATEHPTYGEEMMLASSLPPPTKIRTATCRLCHVLRSHGTSYCWAKLHDKKVTKRGYGFPFDSTSRGFKHTVTVKGFPFEDMQEDTVKLKHTLIASVCFQWGCGSGLDWEVLWECGQRLTESEGATVGTMWFQSPPKVHIISGILGSIPTDETCGGHPNRGEL